MSYIVPRDKPKRCTQPKCRFMDRNTLDCRLQGKSWESFEEQYEHCPLIEIHTPPAEPMVDIRDTQYNLPIGTDTISRQAAIDALHMHLMYRMGTDSNKKRLDDWINGVPSVQLERTCVNCGRTVNNGGWYADGGTRCPIEEHYALPKDGYCHLWEKRNVTDDDYPERRTDEGFNRQTGGD